MSESRVQVFRRSSKLYDIVAVAAASACLAISAFSIWFLLLLSIPFLTFAAGRMASKNVEYVFDGERMVFSIVDRVWGIRREVKVEDIVEVDLQMLPALKFLNVGTVKVYTRAGVQPMEAKYVEDPVKLYSLLSSRKG
jgi:uncharacterized membrane protein YdbT with pleckstrin-like domain